MTLVVDEMTGEAGYLTRLEAFIDLINKRRERKIG
jgi:predicted nucleotide-binding protein (sugar kinase/HSP70/actin superfamily)